MLMAWYHYWNILSQGTYEWTYCMQVMREWDRNMEILKIKSSFFPNFQLLLPVYYFSEGVKACLESFWTKYRH